MQLKFYYNFRFDENHRNDNKIARDVGTDPKMQVLR